MMERDFERVEAADLVCGVALSAGGAAAIAQVGVLEELHGAGLRLECVAGTSAGALVGAAFGAERLGEFRAAMTSLTRARALRLFDPTWPRTGLLEGRRALEFVRPWLGERIEWLPRRYAAVTADLISGSEVALTSGDVVEAIRASIAIPGLFTPCPREGRLLVDGGLVNPIPVSVARALGAQFVIAVSVLRLPQRVGPDRPGLAAQLLARFLSNLGAEPGEPTPLRPTTAAVPAADTELGIVDVLARATRVVECEIAAARLREQPPDFLIDVPVSGVGLFDFHRSAELVEAGRTAAREALPELRRALEAAAPLADRVRRWARAHARWEPDASE